MDKSDGMLILINTVIAAAITASLPPFLFKQEIAEEKRALLQLSTEYATEVQKAKDMVDELAESLAEIEAKNSELLENLALVGGFDELEANVNDLRLQVLRSEGLLSDAKVRKEEIDTLKRDAETKVVQLEQILEDRPAVEEEFEKLNALISQCKNHARQGLNEARSIVREAKGDFSARLDHALESLKTEAHISLTRNPKDVEAFHQAINPGWVIATIETFSERAPNGSFGKRGTVCGYAGPSPSKAGNEPKVKTSVDHKDNPRAVLTMPVKQGEYWSVDYCPISGTNRPRIDTHWVGLELELGL